MSKIGKRLIKAAKEALEYVQQETRMKDKSNDELVHIIKYSKVGSPQSQGALEELTRRNRELIDQIRNNMKSDYTEWQRVIGFAKRNGLSQDETLAMIRLGMEVVKQKLIK